MGTEYFRKDAAGNGQNRFVAAVERYGVQSYLDPAMWIQPSRWRLAGPSSLAAASYLTVGAFGCDDRTGGAVQQFLDHPTESTTAGASPTEPRSPSAGSSDPGAPPAFTSRSQSRSPSDRAATIETSRAPFPTRAPADATTRPSVAPLPADYRTQDEQNSISVFQLAAPSTVFVTQSRRVGGFLGTRGAEVQSGSGTGFIWDDSGHVVTNYHVIKGAQSLSVTLHDQRVFQASVRGVEPRKDIAVLKLQAPPIGLTPISVRDKASNVQVGQKAIAIGNPFGLDHTLTTGVVSALGREVQGIGGVTIRDMVQTDAAINPGNSGGPLLDSAGRLIGMNTMIFSRSGASAGIGFAVPASAIKRVVPQIIATGRAEQVGLGVQIDPSQRLERRLRIQGMVVLRVLPGTPAATAGFQGIVETPQGIRLGDVIVGINEYPIEDYDDLYNTLDRFKAGDPVNVTVVRERKKLSLQLNLVRL